MIGSNSNKFNEKARVEALEREKTKAEGELKLANEEILRMADNEKRLLDEIDRLKESNKQLELQSKMSHVFVSTPDRYHLPTYIDAETLEVSDKEYEVMEKIGKGNFSSVYKGIHTTSKHEVVIKRIEGAAANRKKEKSFVAEISKIRSLVHPGIPIIEAFFKGDEDMCVVFQKSSSRSVKKIMDDNERSNKVAVSSLLPSELLMLTVRLIEILDYVHSTGLIHYDIKPENVLLCDSEYGLQLIDFGSAGFVISTGSTMNAFTLEYSSPERLDPCPIKLEEVMRNKLIMTKLDVWSLGATLLNSCCDILLVSREYDESDELRPYFSSTSLVLNVFENTSIPWNLDVVLSKYFEVCKEAKALWEAVDTDIKDIIKLCLTHDISKRPYIRDIVQMQSFRRLKLKCN